MKPLNVARPQPIEVFLSEVAAAIGKTLPNSRTRRRGFADDLEEAIKNRLAEESWMTSRQRDEVKDATEILTSALRDSDNPLHLGDSDDHPESR